MALAVLPCRSIGECSERPVLALELATDQTRISHRALRIRRRLLRALRHAKRVFSRYLTKIGCRQRDYPRGRGWLLSSLRDDNARFAINTVVYAMS
jgi:hypothetical protein